MGPLEPLGHDVLAGLLLGAQGVHQVVLRVGLVDDVPLDDAALEGADLVPDVPADALAEGLGLVLEGRDVLRHVPPRRPDQAVAAHRDALLLKPSQGLDRPLAVVGVLPLGPLQVVLEDDLVEEALDGVAIAAGVLGLDRQRHGGDGRAEAECMARHADLDGGAREEPRVGRLDDDGKVGFSILLDALSGGLAPRGVGLRAGVGAGRGRRAGFGGADRARGERQKGCAACGKQARRGKTHGVPPGAGA